MFCNFCNMHRRRSITEFHQTLIYYNWSIHFILQYCCAVSQLYSTSNFLIWQCPITAKCIYNLLAIHPVVVWYFATLFIIMRWLAFIRRTKKFKIPNFLPFDAFLRTLKIPGENSGFLVLNSFGHFFEIVNVRLFIPLF